jgi:hypothetical protein
MEEQLFEITQHCTTTRASSDISELNACLNGTDKYIEVRYEGENENGRKIYRYFLKEKFKLEYA